MKNVYLFDWGDTLMVDFQDQQGKMCHWSKVQAVDGALEVLAELSKNNLIYVATNAADSTETEIQEAFERVGLAQYIDGYFCKANLDIGKGTPEFFGRIIKSLNVSPEMITMVGDSFENDIAPAISAGIHVIWLNPQNAHSCTDKGAQQISKLQDILIKRDVDVR